MIKYEYLFDSTTNLTSRAMLDNYPGLDVLELGISAKRPTAKIRTMLLKAYEGLAEEPLVHLEELWWSNQSKIQDLTAEVTKLTELQSTITDKQATPEALTQANTELTNIMGDPTILRTTISKAKDPTIITADDIKTFVVNLETQITTATDTRNLIEDTGYEHANVDTPNPSKWLQAYRGVKTTVTRPKVTFSIPRVVMKQLIAHERNLTVRNLEDTVADLAKSNAMLMSFIGIIYNTLTPTAKTKIPAAEASLMDYAVTKWKTTSTRGDRQLKNEGTKLVDKLYSREVAIADIVDKHK